MFDELGRRLPDIELATDEPLEFRPSNFIVGPEGMPVRFTPTEKLGSYRSPNWRQAVTL